MLWYIPFFSTEYLIYFLKLTRGTHLSLLVANEFGACLGCTPAFALMIYPDLESRFFPKKQEILINYQSMMSQEDKEKLVE